LKTNEYMSRQKRFTLFNYDLQSKLLKLNHFKNFKSFL